MLNGLKSAVDLEIAKQFRDWRTQWSIGSFGAIAEFIRVPNELIELSDKADLLSMASDSGAITLRKSAGATLVPSETAGRHTWTHRVAMCLPATHASMSQRQVLTEIGPDDQAARTQDRSGILFDLGLGVLNTDVCIRTSDPETIIFLRRYLGQPLFGGDHLAAARIVSTHPHRVFISKMGRIEVYAPIPASNDKTPMGSHTHIFPKLLRHNLTHPFTEPIPKNLIPCAHFYPPHPSRGWLGNPRPFDATCHEAFQDLLQKFGDSDLVAFKTRAIQYLRAGKDLNDLHTNTRFERDCVRVISKQWDLSRKFCGCGFDDPFRSQKLQGTIYKY